MVNTLGHFLTCFSTKNGGHEGIFEIMEGGGQERLKEAVMAMLEEEKNLLEPRLYAPRVGP